MKRIRPLRGLAFAFGGLLAGGGVGAQGIHGTDIDNGAAGRARVYAVAGTGKAAPFQVPQVRLPSAAVAGRINRELRRRLITANVQEADSLAPLARQVQQASRVCCYDENLRRWTNWHGFTGCGYQVLFNQGGLLSIAYFEEFTGAYSWERTRHVTFDLRTGRALALTDLLADPPAQLQRRMQGAISRRLTETLQQTPPDDSAYVAEQFRADRAASLAPGQEDGVDLTDFALTPPQLLLFHGVYVAHVVQNLAPDDTYRFPYQRLHPRPLLQRALASTVSQPKKAARK